MGFEIGIIILKKIRNSLAPSTIADSINSLGVLLLKYVLTSRTLKPFTKILFGKSNANIVFLTVTYLHIIIGGNHTSVIKQCKKHEKIDYLSSG